MSGLKITSNNILFVVLVVLSTVLLLSYSYFRIVKESTFRVNEPLSKELASYVNSKIDSLPVANGIQVVKTETRRNVRFMIHAYQTDEELKKMFETFMQSRITMEVPLFSNNFKQNLRTVKMMNHQFECVPYVDTLSYEYVPKSAKYITTVCSISIPPAYGEFRGILAISLRSVPTDVEEMLIKEVLIDLSDRIYSEIK